MAGPAVRAAKYQRSLRKIVWARYFIDVASELFAVFGCDRYANLHLNPPIFGGLFLSLTNILGWLRWVGWFASYASSTWLDI